MSIQAEEVRQMALLARLALSEEEINSLARDLASILDHMQALREADVEGVSPMGGVSEHDAPLREDVVGADPLHLPLDEIAPAREEGFFIVPRLAALDAEGSSQ